MGESHALLHEENGTVVKVLESGRLRVSVAQLCLPGLQVGQDIRLLFVLVPRGLALGSRCGSRWLAQTPPPPRFLSRNLTSPSSWDMAGVEQDPLPTAPAPQDLRTVGHAPTLLLKLGVPTQSPLPSV